MAFQFRESLGDGHPRLVVGAKHFPATALMGPNGMNARIKAKTAPTISQRLTSFAIRPIIPRTNILLHHERRSAPC
jgi:hypothetical protein